MKIIKTHWMTRREWVAKHEPCRVGAAFVAGVEGCPSDHGLPDDEECLGSAEKTNRERCARCYDRPAKVGGKYILVREDR